MRRGLLLAGLAAAVAAYVWVQETQAPLRGAKGPPLSLVVAPGMRAADVGHELHELGLVRHPLVFRILVRQRGADKELRAGRYSLHGTQSLTDIVEQLRRGEAVRHDVTFPEGLSIDEMAAIAASVGIPAAGFRAAAANASLVHDLDPDAKDLEGYLFPDTYDVPENETAARALVLRMVHRFKAVTEDQRARLPERGLSVRDWVTLASIVELETAEPSERGKIAAVFRNRLRKGMPLQTDPTVIFALRRAGPYDGNIRKKDLDIDSPYNTYRYPGLPPGPIASPGRASLLAVLDPAPGDELYFVSRNDGTHEFNESLQQHEKAVTRFQRSRQRMATPPLPRR